MKQRRWGRRGLAWTLVLFLVLMPFAGGAQEGEDAGSTARREEETISNSIRLVVEDYSPSKQIILGSGENAADAEMPPFEQSQVVNHVRISVSAPEGVFPEGAYLEVTIPGGEQWEQVRDAVQEKLPDERQIASAYYFDIKILSAEGEELQPADGQQVKVSFSLEEAGDPNLRAEVFHVEQDEDGQMNAQSLSTTESGETVEASTTGFSVYSLVLSYDQRQYVFLPGLSVSVKDMLSAVGLEGDPTAVSLEVDEDAPLISLTGDRMDNWILKAAREGEERPVFSATIRETEYQILLSVEKVEQETAEISYKDEDGNTQTWKDGYAIASAGTWRSGSGYTGWWVVDQDITVHQRINVVGDVKLILMDGCTLYADGGIQVSAGNALSIYAQEAGTGTLKAASRESNGVQTATGAAIGGALQENGTGNAGTIYICGGNITATTGAKDCAGIGGGTNGSAVVEIGGGSIDATGNGTGMGIGGAGEDTKVTVRGGDVIAKAGSEDGTGIAGLYGSEINFQEGKMTKGATAAPGQTDSNGVTYAPDGSVYTGPSTTSASRLQSEWVDTEADKEKEEEASASSLSTDYVHYSSASSSSYSSRVAGSESTIITSGPGTGDYIVATSGPGEVDTDSSTEAETEGYNVLLATFSPELAEEIRAWAPIAIDYQNHSAGTLPEQSDTDILSLGLEGVSADTLESLWNAPGAPETVDDLIEAYGYVEGLKESESSFGPGQQASTSETQASVENALQWIADNETLLTRTGDPFFMSIHVSSAEGDATSAETDTSIYQLITGLDEAGKLDHTVVICTLDESAEEGTIPLIIFHPDWPEGAVVEAATSHSDVLPTILDLNESSDEGKQNILYALPGRNLISLVETVQEEN